MKIIVDADACPVKEIIISCAKKHALEVVMVCDVAHMLFYNEDFITVITVDQGADSADLAIANRTQADDICITQDYGLASLILAKKATVLHPNGFVYSQETIDRGLITVLAGHNQQEMEDICDSVGFLHEGRLVCSGDLDAMLSDVHRVQLIPSQEVSDEALSALKPLRMQRQGRLCLLTLRGDRSKLEQTLNRLDPLFMEFLPLSLEEVFILEMEDRGYAQH